MTKPRKGKTQEKPTPPEPVAEVPATAENTVADAAVAAQPEQPTPPDTAAPSAGDEPIPEAQEPETSDDQAKGDPEQSDEPEPEAAGAEGERETAEGEEEGEAEQSDEPADEPTDEERHEASPVARSEKVTIGPVEGRIARVPLASVLDILSDASLRRIDAHYGSASFDVSRKRLLATDGRATPVIFEGVEEGPPNLLHGFDELAAAKAVDAETVFVIMLPPGAGSEAQAHIVEMVRQQRQSEQAPDGDELFYRVHAED